MGELVVPLLIKVQSSSSIIFWDFPVFWELAAPGNLSRFPTLHRQVNSPLIHFPALTSRQLGGGLLGSRC